MQDIHSIFIADSNEVLLDGLTTVVSQESTLRVIGTARNGKELLDKAARCSPEVYLVDFDLPDHNGIQISQALLRQKKTSRVILLTDNWENSLIKRIMASGVKGCLHKTCDADELIFAIHRVLDGKHYFSGYHNEETLFPPM